MIRPIGVFLGVVLLGTVLWSLLVDFAGPPPASGQATVAESSEGVPGPPGPTLTGADTDVCFVNGTNAVCDDSGIQWHTTTKRLSVSDSGNNTMLADGAGYAPDIPGGGRNNVLIGHNAGAPVHTGAGDVCIGSGSCASMTEMDFNTVIGFAADPDSIEGNGDVIIGYQAGRGSRAFHDQLNGNVIVGSFAGSTAGNTDIANVMIGTDVLPTIDGVGNQDAGSENVAIGHRAGYRAAKLEGTVIIGKDAAYNANLGLTHDIVIGKEAMNNAPGGNSDVGNIAIGYRALRSENSSGDGNIAIGELALTAQTDGGANTAIGDGALKLLVHGFENTAVGYNVGAHVTGSGNNLVSFYTLYQKIMEFK